MTGSSLSRHLLEVQGDSMSPYLQSGDLLLIEPHRQHSQQKIIGELYGLTAQQHEMPFVHRYVGSGLYKGDRNPHFDNTSFEGLCSHSKIVGRVISRKHHKELMYIPFHRVPAQLFHRILGEVSLRTTRKHWPLSKLLNPLSLTLGALFRWLEETLLSTPLNHWIKERI